MEQPILKTEDLCKVYQLGVIGNKTLTADLQSWWARVRHREDPNLKIGKSPVKRQKFTALDNVNFSVQPGERVGIIGANGAGKSTLLKLISRITGPTEGRVYLNGRVASMLEVGTGFHADLTGRENIFLNGAILGMSRESISKKLDEIIEFSECGEFIDTPIKRYSSGMMVKLGFAVSAHLDNEILIMDEVLAVGDSQFQQKCLNKMNEVSAQEGRTILYVSHLMGTIRQLCSRCIVLSHGKLIFDGDVEQAISIYLENVGSLVTEYDFTNAKRQSRRFGVDARLVSLSLTGTETAVYLPGQHITGKIHFTTQAQLDSLYLRFLVYHTGGDLVGTAESAPLPYTQPGKYEVAFSLSPERLSPGSYFLVPSLFSWRKGRESLFDQPMTNVYFETKDLEATVPWDHRGWGHVSLGELKVE